MINGDCDIAMYSGSLSSFNIPAAPTNVQATDGGYTVKISWTASSGATGYKIFRNTTNNSGSAVQIDVTTTPNITSYEEAPPKVGTTYYYWVKAYSDFDSAFSGSDSGWRKAPEQVVLLVHGWQKIGWSNFNWWETMIEKLTGIEPSAFKTQTQQLFNTPAPNIPQ